MNAADRAAGWLYVVYVVNVLCVDSRNQWSDIKATMVFLRNELPYLLILQCFTRLLNPSFVDFTAVKVDLQKVSRF
jgi:hypothetical protein